MSRAFFSIVCVTYTHCGHGWVCIYCGGDHSIRRGRPRSVVTPQRISQVEEGHCYRCMDGLNELGWYHGKFIHKLAKKTAADILLELLDLYLEDETFCIGYPAF